MPRRGHKHALTLLLAALFALGLTACGGSGDSTTEATTATPTTSSGQGSSGGGSGQGKGAGDPQDGDTGGAASSDGDSSADSGGAEEGSTSFRTPGGDNSIQNYGEEAEPSEREAAEAALVSFMEARAKRDWGAACPYLAKAAVAPLEALAKKTPQLKAEGCAPVLATITAAAPPVAFVNTLEGPVAGLRIKGERGFALYHGPKGVDYFVPMVNEDGEWKVGTISPSEFPGSGG